MTSDRVRSISDNVYMVLIARIAMVLTPIIASGLVWLGGQWLDGKFDALSVPLIEVKHRVDTLESSDRMSAITNNSQQIFIDSNKEAIGKVAEKVDGLGQDLNEVTSSLKALTDVLKDRDGRKADSQ